MRVRLWMRARGLVAVAGVLACAAAPEARGQASGAGESPRKRPIGLEELTITARKREGRLQELPLTASAIAGPQLRDVDARGLGDLDGLVPNLAVAETSRGPRVHVRGIGEGDAPGVGLYLDGVYLTRAEAGLFTLSDVERVEVLRGPQSTQFGKSTLGGAVNVITRKPELDDFASKAEVRVGNYDRLDTRLALNVPLMAERAAARVSFAMTSRDGFQKLAGGGRDRDDDRRIGVRTQLLAAPREDLELVLALDGSRERRRPQGYRCRAAGADPALEACAEDARRGTRRIARELGGGSEQRETYGTSVTARFRPSETLTLTSISAWRRHELEAARDLDPRLLPALALDLASAGGEQQDQISQELQVGGRALRGKLSYMAGLFWLAQSVSQSGKDDARLEIDSRGYAVYGQGTYALTDRLSATLGARLGAERRRIERDAVDAAARSRDLSPLATLRYELSEGAHVYGTWSRGFRSGGFDRRAADASLARALGDEKLTAYEIGFKSLFLDSRFQLNAALFHSVYDDIQLAPALESTAGAEIEGAELELRAVPSPGFELSSALGVTRARYSELAGPAQSEAAARDTREDGRLAGVPSYTLSFGASYQLPLGALGDLRLRSSWTHIGRSAADAADSRILRQGKHGELDAQLAWTLPDGLTEIALLGSNLLDREYAVDGVDLGASLGGALLIYNAPRTYGVEVRRTF